MKFWIGNFGLMLKGSHVSDHVGQILPNFESNFGQTWPNFGQNFQKPKSDIYRVQKCLLSIFERFGPFGPILEFG